MTLQVMFLLLGTALGLWILYRLRIVLLQLVLAVFFAYLVAPLLRVLRQTVSVRGRNFRSRGVDFLGELNETLAADIRTQVTACLLIGVVCTLGFAVIGIPYAVVLGIAAGLLEFIPLAGPLAVVVLAASFAAFHSLGQALAVVIFLVVLRAVQDYVVYPKIVGKRIPLHLWPSSSPSCAAQSWEASWESSSRSRPSPS